jgi:hypothetical protein
LLLRIRGVHALHFNALHYTASGDRSIMAKRKISVEEFTNDVLAGMTDSELMQKYRISRKHLDAMFAKLLQRGELQAADLNDETQKALEPTLELAATCPHCGALNLFGAGLCPECGQSRVTRHFKAVDTQDVEPLATDSQAGIPQNEPLASEDLGDLGDLEGLAELDVIDAAEQTAGRAEIEPTPPAPIQPEARRPFLFIAAAALCVVMGVVAVGLYTERLSLPFGASPSQPNAVQKPVPQGAPLGPSPKRIAGVSPGSVPQPPGQLPAEPVHAPPASVPETPPRTAQQTMPIPAIPQVEKPSSPAVAKEPALELPKAEPPAPEVKKLAAVEPNKEAVREKAEETSSVKTGQVPPGSTQETAPESPKVEPTAPEEEKTAARGVSRETAPEKATRLSSVSPPAEPDSPATVEEPAASVQESPGPPDAARPDKESPPESFADATKGPPALEQAALLPATPPPSDEPIPRKQRDMGPLLIEAVRNGDPDMVNVLMDGGADPDSADSEGATALMFAARTRCLSCVAALLKRGADVRLKDRRGDTALDIARRAGRTTAAEMILAHDPEKGRAALLIATREGLADVVQCLVENGVDVNATDQEGNTALMAASETGNLNIVSILLGKGADVRARNKHGQTALTVVSRTDSATGRVPTRIRRQLVRMLEQHTTPGTEHLQLDR